MSGPVLVIAHDRDLVMLLAALVNLSGQQAIRARDGHTALAQARRYHPTLVLLDVPTPGLATLTLIAGLRERVPDAPIVLMSARDDNELLARNVTIAGYIRRPFDIREVLDYIEAGTHPLEQALGA